MATMDNFCFKLTSSYPKLQVQIMWYIVSMLNVSPPHEDSSINLVLVKNTVIILVLETTNMHELPGERFMLKGASSLLVVFIITNITENWTVMQITRQCFMISKTT